MLALPVGLYLVLALVGDRALGLVVGRGRVSSLSTFMKGFAGLIVVGTVIVAVVLEATSSIAVGVLSLRWRLGIAFLAVGGGAFLGNCLLHSLWARGLQAASQRKEEW